MPGRRARGPCRRRTGIDSVGLRRGEFATFCFLSGAVWLGVLVVVVTSRVTSGEGLAGWMLAAHCASALFGLLLSPLAWQVVPLASKLARTPRFALLAGAMLALAIGHAVVNAWLWVGFMQWWGFEADYNIFRGATASGVFRYIFIYSLFLTASALVRELKEREAKERELAEARAAAHQAQLAALRFQLNPHFLFNTLNALSALVMAERNEEAETMIGKLSDFLRSSLVSDPEKKIALEEEIRIAETYLDIESVRFRERIGYRLHCPPALARAEVPAFLLQPLLENAVKYAVAPSRRPVTIRVSAAEEGGGLVIRVEDDGADGPGAGSGGTGIGLANVRDRLKALYGAAGTMDAVQCEPGFKVTLRLPLNLLPEQGRAAA